MLLEIKDLRVDYGKARALESVSLHVDEGEVVSIIGANGAGKSTIIRTISGLGKPVAGEIRFRDTRIDGLPPHKIVRMGIIQIPAGRMIFGPMTVMDNLRMGAYLRTDHDQVKRDLSLVFDHFPVLRERQAQLGGELSGGQQQMLAVGRALMAAPRLILMDEPSVGLSPILVSEVARIIREINQSGISILLVEQNSRMALKLSKRAYVLELGRITLEGDAGSLAADERVAQSYLGSG